MTLDRDEMGGTHDGVPIFILYNNSMNLDGWIIKVKLTIRSKKLLSHINFTLLIKIQKST